VTPHYDLTMLVYCGLDEAGYGPLLGPLCVAAAAFEVADTEDGKAPDLWQRLKSVVASSTSDRSKIAIADSKKLKGAKDGKAHPLRHLERGVLAALGSVGPLPTTDTELFERLGVVVDSREASPWYEAPLSLPIANERDLVAIAANRLRVASDGAGVGLAVLACEAVDGLAFNRATAKSQKSDLNFCVAMRHVERLWSSFAARHPRIVIDRQGGRTHYREPLQLCFPGARLTILGETDALSRYRLERDGSLLTLSFESESESRHLPSALASMTAKYVRELFMERMNRFFRGHLPELKPTAGYVEDGRRYLEDVRPVLRRLKIREDQLVRGR